MPEATGGKTGTDGERRKKVEEMGMTNEQYKGMLIDELEDWQEVLDMAKEDGNERITRKAERQITKINEKLKF